MKRKMRVMHVIPTFGTGGAERLVVDLLEASDREQYELAVVSLYPEIGTMLEKEIRMKSHRVIFLDKHLGIDLGLIPKLYRLFRRFKPDVLHTHLYVLRYTLLPALISRIPVLVHTVHTTAENEVVGVARLVHYGAYLLGAVVPVSISSVIAQSVRAVYGSGIETPVIYNGVSTPRFSFAVHQENETSTGKGVLILHIGRFSPEKNHKLLADAFAQAVEEVPNMRLRFVGAGKLRSDVQKAVSDLGLKDKVFFLGIRADVAELLAECDFLILSSDYEGVPLTVIEAMVAAKPVVATAVGGVPELVEDGVTGLLVPPRDSKALARAIIRLANDQGLRQIMGQEGRKRALVRFDISNTARSYEALYSRLLNRRTRP